MQGSLGTPNGEGATKALLLGSGELGKELVIELQRLGSEVVACDRYPNAPAMQVAHRSRVFDMQDSQALLAVVAEEKPSLIIPEIEAISTATLLELECEGLRVVPTALAAHLTMDREGIRRLAAETLGLPTARYAFASKLEELREAASDLGYPCVLKPLMSSSGKGQSVVRTEADLEESFRQAREGSRGSSQGRVIVEEFIPFESEITLLTVRSIGGTVFCPPIGHRQEGGDYVESWQPHPMSDEQLKTAKSIAKHVTDELGGYGLFGVELFLLGDGRVLFSEVSPRPHDTGMVTLVTQDLSEFALHARAILHLPVHEVKLWKPGASAALRATDSLEKPLFKGVTDALEDENVSIRLFGKPSAHKGRRMGVLLATSQTVSEARERAVQACSKITMVSPEARE